MASRAYLATLPTEPPVTSLSRGYRQIATVASWVFPVGLGGALFAFYNVPTLEVFYCHEFILIASLISTILLFSFSLVRIWTSMDDNPKILADLFRDAGVLPQTITVFTCLTALIAVFSFFSYSLFFLIRSHVPMWQRRGKGSWILYMNAVISGLEIIFAATLIKLVSSVRDSLMKHSGVDHSGVDVNYALGCFELLQGTSSLLGFLLMVAGPSFVQLPENYEPISKLDDHPSRSIVSTVEAGAQTNRGVPQAILNQPLANLYQAQQQRRHQLVIETKGNFASVLEYNQHNPTHANAPETAAISETNSTPKTKFDDGSFYWSGEERAMFTLFICEGMAVLCLIYTPIQITRFVKHLTWKSQDCKSLCYFDFATSFLGAPIFIICIVITRYRIDLRKKLWPNGPSYRQLILIYYFSTLLVYLADIILIAAVESRNPFDGDIFISSGETGPEGYYTFSPLMTLLLLLLGLLGRSWARYL